METQRNKELRQIEFDFNGYYTDFPKKKKIETRGERIPISKSRTTTASA